MDPRIRIHSKMSWIQNTGLILLTYLFFCRRKPCQILLYLSSIFAEGILVKLYRTSLLYLRIRYRTEMLDARMPMKMKLKVPTEDFAGSSVIMVVFNVCYFLFVPPPPRQAAGTLFAVPPGAQPPEDPGPVQGRQQHLLLSHYIRRPGEKVQARVPVDPGKRSSRRELNTLGDAAAA
jgi:hypothetical protein